MVVPKTPEGPGSSAAQNGGDDQTRTFSRVERDFILSRSFSPSAPIDQASLFKGRTEQVRDVLDAIGQRGQHVMLFGERGVGKTSLANVIGQLLEDAGQNVLAPRINCDATDDFSAVWHKVFAEIPVTIRRRQAGFGGRAEDASSSVGALTPSDRDLVPDDVRQLLHQYGQGGLLVVILDEFDRLKPAARALFADTVKTLSDQGVAATIVLVGVGESVTDLIHEHESVARSLMQVKMPRMSEIELVQIIRDGLPQAGLTIDAEAVVDILALAQGLPHYMHLLSLYAARAAVDRESDVIQNQDVQTAIRRAVDRAMESITRGYHQATSSARKDNLYRQVLLACALAVQDFRGTFAAADVRSPMQAITGQPYDIPAFSPHLNAFTEPERGPVLQKSGTPRNFRFRFVDPLLQPYVIMRGVADGLLDATAIRGRTTVTSA